MLFSAIAWPRGDPEAVVREILARPEYHEVVAGASSGASPWERLWNRLEDFIIDLWRNLFHGIEELHGRSDLARIVGIIMILLAAGAIIASTPRLLRGAFRFFRARHRAQGSSALIERDSSGWHALSFEHAAQGRYAAAVGAIFMAALRLLDERSVVTFDAARTPNEYRFCIARALTKASPSFDELSMCFVRAVYGSVASERALYDRAACAYAAFSAFVPGVGSA